MPSGPTPKTSSHIPVNFVPAATGEIIKLGAMTLRIMEDGSRTDNRLGMAEITIPGKTPGPPAHWHEMHDETFITTQGTVRFHLPQPESETGEAVPDKFIDAKVGDYVTVPIRAPHTFSNPFDEEAKFLNTYTPAFYINYFKMLAEIIDGGAMTPEANMEAMANFATVAVQRAALKK